MNDFSRYQYLKGKNKKQVKEELGQEFNYYHARIWSYLLKTNWLGRKTVLILHFKDDLVETVKIKKCYAKIDY